jgi:hypothetical protein
MPRLLLALLLAFALGGGIARGQSEHSDPGTIDATISTQNGTVLLPGVLVLVRGAGGDQVAEQVSDGGGHVSISGLAPGVYRLQATLDGFDAVERPVTLARDSGASVAIDMAISAVSERVDVVATAPIITGTGTLAASETVSNTQAQWLAPGGNVQSALRLLSNVITTPSGESINGGRPHQAGFQLGAATLIDPANNLARAWLPADALDSVTVLPNPYETEYGRFSSGLVSVQTRRGSDNWRFAINNTIPAFRTKRYTIANIEGIGAVKPSVETGGPLVKGRVFLEEAAQYSWFSTDVPSRPEDELKTTQLFGSLTRIDANVSPRHTLAFTGGFDDSEANHATLGTFTPPDATANVRDNLGYAIASERASLTGATFLETTLQVHTYRARVAGQGKLPMKLLPETTFGDFYNDQDRETSAVQWVEAASTSRAWPGGQHLIKIGSDVMAATYDGHSASAPVIVARSNGTVARRLDFPGPSVQEIHSLDVAVFVQDRIQPSKRWYVEIGARVDRDGVAEDVSASPRAGVAILLNASATAVLRGGYGEFYERTPSVAGVFRAFDSMIDSRYADDGVTMIGPALPVARIVGDLQSAHSAMWDIAYDHRLSPRWALHASILDRHGEGELILDSERDATGERLVLTSDGQSRFLQEEVGVHLMRGSRMDVNATYVHASAHEDLNAFLGFYDTLMSPIVGRNEYAPAAADVPHRLFVRGQVMPTSVWSLVGTFDWRGGLPYSVVNETLDFVGPRNTLRFPTYMRTELGLDRRITVAHAHPWIGIRAANALAAFLPTDVQANIGSPAFGSFYNSEYRQLRIHVRFER